MVKNIAVIRGDGIGPEIVNEALKVLQKVATLYGHTFNYTDVDMGGCAIDKYGDPLPESELKKCVEPDSVVGRLLFFFPSLKNLQDFFFIIKLKHF